MAAATGMVQAFDSHLRANFTVSNGSPSALRITLAPAAAQPLRRTATGVYRAGGDISNPIPISRPEPEYSEEAHQAKLEGSVLLSLGDRRRPAHPQNINVVKPLGLGLDEKAIEAVSSGNSSRA